MYEKNNEYEFMLNRVDGVDKWAWSNNKNGLKGIRVNMIEKDIKRSLKKNRKLENSLDLPVENMEDR